MGDAKDEIWTTRDGRKVAVGDMEPDHAKNVLRMLIRRDRRHTRAMQALTACLLPHFKAIEEAKAEADAKFHEDVYNDAMSDKLYGSD